MPLPKASMPTSMCTSWLNWCAPTACTPASKKRNSCRSRTSSSGATATTWPLWAWRCICGTRSCRRGICKTFGDRSSALSPTGQGVIAGLPAIHPGAPELDAGSPSGMTATLLPGSRHQHRRVAVNLRHHALEVGDLRAVEPRDVGRFRMQGRVILVISLGWIEGRQRRHLRDDPARENMRRFQLRDVALGHLFLAVVGEENGGPVLRARVRPLAIELRRIVRHREVDLQQLAVRDLLRIVSDLHRFGMAGRARAHGFVIGRFLLAAGITGDRI